MNKLRYILHRVTVLLVLLFVVASAMAKMTVYVGNVTTLGVEEVPGETYFWELYTDSLINTVNFATTAGNCPAAYANFVAGNTGATVDVKWNKPGIYFFKITAYSVTGCTNNLEVGIVEVLEALPTAVLTQPDPVCIGDWLTMEVTLTGTGPWDITYTDGTSSWTIKGIPDPVYQWPIKPTVPSWYWVTEVKDAYGINNKPSEKVWIEVKPKPNITPIYQYGP